jgi:hypothetical protein
MKTPALSALLDRFHNFPMPGNPDQHNCYCGPEEIEAARAELAELTELAEADKLPCYLCAVPGKDKRARTTICASCGYALKVEVESLRTENRARAYANRCLGNENDALKATLKHDDPAMFKAWQEDDEEHARLRKEIRLLTAELAIAQSAARVLARLLLKEKP